MKKIFVLLSSVIVGVMALAANASVHSLPFIERVSPASVGIEPKQLVLMYDSLLTSDLTELHHVVVMVDGKIVGDLHPYPFRSQHRHTLYSVSKTFVAVAVGLAVDDGLLSVDDRLSKFFPQYSETISEVRIKDMLTMQSGFKTEGGMRNSKLDWIDYYLSRPLEAKPGTRYSYDSIETYLLSAVVQKVTGKTVLELLNERIFRPMSITDVEWELCPNGIVTGGWGIYMSSYSQALFGQLLLNKGMWNGERLISQSWIEQMMTVHVVREANDYGYQIWLCEYPGAWRADGAFGQYIIIVPQKNMVVVLNQCSRSKGWPERGNIWNTIVKNCFNCPIETTPEALKSLNEYERNASLPLLKGEAKNSLASEYDNKTISLKKNKLGWKSVTFRFKTENEYVLEVVDAEGKRSHIALGYNRWAESQLAGWPHYSIGAQNRFSGISGPFYSGACYAWQSDNTLQAKIHYTNWVTSLLLTFDFAGKTPVITVSENFPSKPFEIVAE